MSHVIAHLCEYISSKLIQSPPVICGHGILEHTPESEPLSCRSPHIRPTLLTSWLLTVTSDYQRQQCRHGTLCCIKAAMLLLLKPPENSVAGVERRKQNTINCDLSFIFRHNYQSMPFYTQDNTNCPWNLCSHIPKQTNKAKALKPLKLVDSLDTENRTQQVCLGIFSVIGRGEREELTCLSQSNLPVLLWTNLSIWFCFIYCDPHQSTPWRTFSSNPPMTNKICSLTKRNECRQEWLKDTFV